MVQPDLGTAIVLAGISAAMFMASRLNQRQLGASFLIVVVCLGLGWVSLKSYQRTRIEVFLNHTSDDKGSNYNVRQSIIAVGSGGLTGQGIGRGSQSELNFLPVADTDFMFATAAEATGLVGSLVLLSLYGLLIWRIWRLTTETNDPFAMLVAVGVGSMLLIQVIVNVGMNIGLLPVTGIPLPFVSHGGSSLIIALFLVGILLRLPVVLACLPFLLPRRRHDGKPDLQTARALCQLGGRVDRPDRRSASPTCCPAEP